MNPLAQELNRTLAGSSCEKLLSDFGRKIYFPKGIVTQSAEAGQHAHKFDATIGMAYNAGNPIELKAIREQLPLLSPKEAVAYASTPGDVKLRALWKKEIYKKNPSLKDTLISDPIIVPGLTNGLSQITDLFINPGDTVVTPDMFWGNYRLMMEVRNGGILKEFPLFNSHREMNIDGMISTMKENAVNGKIILLLNFPNNPTGYSPSVTEAKKIVDGIKKLGDEGYNILVISDDAYFGLFFGEDTLSESIFSLLADVHENVLSVKVDGATKEDYVWGFRIGFVSVNSKSMNAEQYEAFNRKIGGAIRASVSNSSRPAQSILLKAMDNPEYQKEKDEITIKLKERFDKVNEIITRRSTGHSLVPMPFNSGYFMAFDFQGGNAEELRKELLYKKGIGTISIKDRYLRIAYASVDIDQMETLYNEIFDSADSLQKG